MVVGVLFIFLGVRSIVGRGRRFKLGEGLALPSLVTGPRAILFGVFCFSGAVVTFLPYSILLFRTNIDLDKSGILVVSVFVAIFIVAFGLVLSAFIEFLTYIRNKGQNGKV